MILIGVFTSFIVVHPVEHDFRRPVPPGGHVSCHLGLLLSGEAKIQNLNQNKYLSVNCTTIIVLFIYWKAMWILVQRWREAKILVLVK